MSEFTRRKFLKFAGAAGAASAAGLTLSGCEGPGAGASAKSSQASTGPAHVVVIGGGFGGATAAKYIRKLDPSVKVTLIEKAKTYYTCPGSNWVLGGMRTIASIGQTYDSLASKHGVKVVHDWVTGIDAEKRHVALESGGHMSYDRLIVSPGIDFKWDGIEGYNEEVSKTIPHAWKAGHQTATLYQQLAGMRDGGTFVICPPPNPFRCPPGPYERVSMVAHFMKQHKPKSKIIILDAKPKFSKQGLFTQGWKDLYGFGTDNSMIEYIPSPNGKVVRIDAKNRVAIAGDLEEEYKADVLNVIPAQKAGWIAAHSGLTNESGWCPVNPLTWESTLVPHVHVIGDSSIAGKMPKSGYSANSQAKVCAAAVVDMLAGREPGTPSWVNTCYSLVGPNYGISVAAVYTLSEAGVVGVKGAGGLTPADGNRSLEAIYADSWWTNVTDDIWG
ncbi:MAG: FAD-dependent oxidoreductase [Chromatiales bacterium]|nr:FAD-dependent oxidoreductase [Chromatiales bacterium]